MGLLRKKDPLASSTSIKVITTSTRRAGSPKVDGGNEEINK